MITAEITLRSDRGTFVEPTLEVVERLLPAVLRVHGPFLWTLDPQSGTVVYERLDRIERIEARADQADFADFNIPPDVRGAGKRRP